MQGNVIIRQGNVPPEPYVIHEEERIAQFLKSQGLSGSWKTLEVRRASSWQGSRVLRVRGSKSRFPYAQMVFLKSGDESTIWEVLSLDPAFAWLAN